MSLEIKPQIVIDDPWLEPFTHDILIRMKNFSENLAYIENEFGSLENFANGHRIMGINYDEENKGWRYKEWAPGAYRLTLIGDFNNWDRNADILNKNEDGTWEIFIPEDRLKEGTRVKVHVTGKNGAHDRIPAYMTRVEQQENNDFVGIVRKGTHFQWTDDNFSLKEAGELPIIYEGHVGMAQEKEGVGTYREFKEKVLPRVKDLGYNTLQLMAIAEHPYYGSFGYHVSNFFAPTSRFGSNDDLKDLINEAHNMGIAVIMDIVHSHSVKNFSEGLNEFDGTDDQYFHPGGRGYHNAWDSKLFNYGRKEVKQFLLSNVRYWMEEYHIDGFRFDGVTSMLYFHHGDIAFDHYGRYFKDGVEWDAIVYLQLANELIHRLKPDAISIAEDMSGMPGICRKPLDGGIGFDFRLGMGLPDFWIKYLKHKRDEDWNIYEMWETMTNRRWKEGTIAYAESHDQALVGDKTIAFWLMDKEMYWHMGIHDEHMTITRGIALHKMIRLFTIALGGEGYLNFFGNEFGHPEWIDFPREGNGWSYKYAQRKWSMADHPELRYQHLLNFDREMIGVIRKNKVLKAPQGQQLNMDAQNNVIIFERANLIFLFNFNTTYAIPDYEFTAHKKGVYKIILCSDDARFGGFDRVDTKLEYICSIENKLKVYLPNRTGLVMKMLGE